MSLSLALLLPAVIVLAGLLERVRPLRKAPATWPGRLPSNLALLLLGVVTDRVLQPAVALLSAWLAAGLGAGLIGRLALPGPVAVLIGVLACDLGTYLIHRLMHTPALWRLHALHHSDRELDWSTSFRHHPFEKIASSLLFGLWTVLIGIPIDAVLIGLLTISAWDTLSHSNWRMPAALERVLARVLVTPQVHALHHSTLSGEADSNYGSILLIWDRLFGTWRASDRAPAAFGLSHDIGGLEGRLLPMLRLPFSSELHTGPASTRR